MTTVVGVDPGSERHALAIYQNAKLLDLRMMALVEIRRWIDEMAPLQGGLLFSIEDVMSQNFVYTRNARNSKAAHAKVALSVGRCQQAQVELMRELDDRGITYVLHRPVVGNWASTAGKVQMERITGWSGRSNADTRSAAFFGYLALRRTGVQKPAGGNT